MKLPSKCENNQIKEAPPLANFTASPDKDLDYNICNARY